MSVTRDLLQVRALLSAASSWCVGKQGCDKNNNYVNPWDERCVRRCVLGAINFVGGGDYATPRSKAMLAAFPVSMDRLVKINNNDGRLAVLALIDKAIERKSVS